MIAEASRIVVVLHRPQRLVNIAGSIRAMKNMGLSQLRLVEPAEYDAHDIAGIAHRCDDILAQARIVANLDAALADCRLVVGTSARRRDGGPAPQSPRDAAGVIRATARDATVALVFGPEDNGLSARELDRCHALIRIPTAPDYASLNLAQAVLLVCYEIAQHEPAPAPVPLRSTPPADAAQLEQLVAVIEQALWGIDFFKAHLATGMMRSVRRLIYRAAPTAREAALLTAMCRETLNALRRRDARPD
ncbi:MAG: RNA methyltransferase [Chloroflexi bacterium]|nr:RNA methyltransferase [Chloroflexota bacterium]